MPLKTIKIFIASSSELKEDRDAFALFISRENERLVEQDLFLKLVQWEHFLDSISDTSKQDDYNNAIRQCDMVLCLFFTKVGKYTAEEFNTAYQVFKDTGKPKIWTYFKNVPVNIEAIAAEINTLIDFKKKIGALGHFYTSYTSIDNLNLQFKYQLENILPQITQQNTTLPPKSAESIVPANENEPQKNLFNELLTRRLIEATQGYNPWSKKFLDNATRIATDWETQTRFSDKAKEIIAISYVGVVGIQLRKLMAIGKEDMSDNKLKNYLDNCQLTSKRALQLLCFILISKLWDYKKNTNYTLSPTQAATCKNFFDDEFESDINGYINLLTTLTTVYTDNSLDFPMPELNEFKLSLQTGSEFLEACGKLQAISSLLDKSSYTAADCSEAEARLATVLENMRFLANYKMVSIKSINYFELRNSKPHYLYNYTALGIDVKANVNQEKVNYAEVPINTDAVLLYKANYQENLALFPFVNDVNLFPFIIDVNALSVEGGAKICFYNSHNNSDGSLNYNFLEDNSIVNIVNTKTLKPDSNINEINELLLDPKKSKDMRFDNVFTLFRAAKKAVTGIDDDDFENSF